MRYPAGYKEERRKQLLKSSGALIKNNGFAATGVDALMAEAGVTSGAFYSNFASKNELLQALVVTELCQSRAIWETNPHDSPEAWIDFEVDRYLSLPHVKCPSAGCVLPALGAEIGRAAPDVKMLFEREQRKNIAILAEKLGSEALAWAFTAQMVGTVLMARAMPTQEAQLEVLSAGKTFLKAMIANHAGGPGIDNPSQPA
ncbi:TetR/AcrR family transcriptional regulator [Pseudomonas batumici]|uniref:TetR/AcrR family transcriptional regulator n=1 Tax=Pseudomonas batumici TaxID=226910 RepID=UPI0030D126E9